MYMGSRMITGILGKLFTALLLLVPVCLPAGEAPSEVQSAIGDALRGKWIFEFYEKNKIGWGFDSTTKLSDIRAGEPFQLFRIPQDKFEKANEKSPVDSLITPADDWLVPLYVQGKLMPSVLWIGTRFGWGDKWSAGIRSGKSLIHGWEKIRSIWSEKAGYHPKFIAVEIPLMAQACFFVPEKGDTNLTAIGAFFEDFSLPLEVDTTFTMVTPSSITLRSLRALLNDAMKGL